VKPRKAIVAVIVAMMFLMVLACSAQNEPVNDDSLLQITSPSTGTVKNIGDTVLVYVTADPAVSGVGIMSSLTNTWQQTQNGNAYVFSFKIPGDLNTLGKYNIGTVGRTPTNPVFGQSIQIDVETNQTPTNVQASKGQLFFDRLGETLPTSPSAMFYSADLGKPVPVQISESSYLQYSSRDSSIATVDKYGMVTAVGVGKTAIDLAWRGTNVYSLPVVVNAPRIVCDDLSASAAATPQANSAGWNNSDVTLNFSAVGCNVQSIVLSATGAQSGKQTLTGASGSYVISAEGTTTVSYFATNADGEFPDVKTITVKLDKTPPVITGMPSNCTLWPPDGKMVTVATVSAADALSGLAAFNVNATSNEPPDPDSADIVITGAGLTARTVSLRAQRLGTGTGRVYTIAANATDIAGNTASQTADCLVPHDEAK